MSKRTWKTVTRGNKVTLNEPFTFTGMSGYDKTIPMGDYYICGFWADACGLSMTRAGFNDYVIPSRGLIYFEGIKDEPVRGF